MVGAHWHCAWRPREVSASSLHMLDQLLVGRFGTRANSAAGWRGNWPRRSHCWGCCSTTDTCCLHRLQAAARQGVYAAVLG